jgi:predicted transcriptional regulator
MATRDQELTEAEWEIIQVVWERQPCAAPTVQEELAARRKWTYSTVKTLMDRMVTKGLLTTERIRNLMLYRSAIAPRGRPARRAAQDGQAGVRRGVHPDDAVHGRERRALAEGARRTRKPAPEKAEE